MPRGKIKMGEDEVTVRVVCDACNGTGLYQGFAEPKDTAVVCLGCRGTGCAILTYEPFAKRKRKRAPHIKWVARSRGSFIATGCGPGDNKVSISDFYKGKMP